MIYPYSLTFFASVLDFLITKSAIEKTDLFIEVNPIMRHSVIMFGTIWAILIVKTFVLLIAGMIGLTIWHRWTELQTSIKRISWAVCVLQTSITIYGAILIHFI